MKYKVEYEEKRAQLEQELIDWNPRHGEGCTGSADRSKDEQIKRLLLIWYIKTYDTTYEETLELMLEEHLCYLCDIDGLENYDGNNIREVLEGLDRAKGSVIAVTEDETQIIDGLYNIKKTWSGTVENISTLLAILYCASGDLLYSDKCDLVYHPEQGLASKKKLSSLNALEVFEHLESIPRSMLKEYTLQDALDALTSLTFIRQE